MEQITSIDEKPIISNAVLIDYHKTIINDLGLINDSMIELINTLSINYKIIIFTASTFDKKQYKKAIELLNNNEINFTKFLYVEENLGNDVDTKLALYQSISSKYKVKFLIDNNKKVVKEFVKLGIYGLRAKCPIELKPRLNDNSK